MGEPLPKQVLDTAVDPDEIVHQTFELGRRGYDQNQVQEYLRAVAHSLQDAQKREADMRTRLGKAVKRAERAEKAAREVPAPDLAELHRHLGDEVTTVLEAARIAAEERVAAAEKQAQKIEEEAATAADTRATDLIGEAQVEATTLHEQARSDAESMLEKAASRVEQARNECDALIHEAEEARGQILEDMERRRRQARAQVERLRVGRDRLLRSYDVVRRTLDETTVDLKSSLKEAKVRGDSAARDIASQPLASRQQLETELADAKLIGRVKISDPHLPAPAPLRSAALPRRLDPPLLDPPRLDSSPSGPAETSTGAPTPRKPRVSEVMKAAERRSGPIQPKAPAVAPVLSASPAKAEEPTPDPEALEIELAELEDDSLNVLEPSDEIEEVIAMPAGESAGNELFALLRIQSSPKRAGSKPPTKAQANKAAIKAKSTSTKSGTTKKAVAKKKKAAPGKVASATDDKVATTSTEAETTTEINTMPVEVPGLEAQRDAVIADAAKQLEKRLKRALADEQNDLLASIRATKKKKNVALTDVVGDVDAHIQRYVLAINDVAVVTYGAGAALIDAEPVEGHLPAGAVEELLEVDVVLPLRECLQTLDALKLETADNHVDPVRAFYRQRKTDHLGFAASRLAELLCVAGLHDAQA